MARVGPAQDERLSQAFYEAWAKFLDAEGNGKGKRRDETITLGFQGGWAAAWASQAARITALTAALGALVQRPPILPHGPNADFCTECDVVYTTGDYYPDRDFPHAEDCPWSIARALLEEQETNDTR